MAPSKLIQIIDIIKTRTNLSTYAIQCKLDELDAPCSRQSLDRWRNENPQLCNNLVTLCLLRRIGGLTWADYGKILDGLFTDKK